MWYEVNFGDAVGHDVHVGEGETTLVDNRGGRELCLAWG